MRSDRHPVNFFASVLTVAGLALGSPLPSSSETGMYRVDRKMLCVTEGTIEEVAGHRLSVKVPKMRAYVNRWSLQTVAATFTYLGPTEGEAKLRSGETRRQFGLKLHAQEACNVVYAMWRMEPELTLVVSVKSNPGQHTSVECGNRGYRNIKPIHHSPVPVLRPGDKHQLRAEMNEAGEKPQRPHPHYILGCKSDLETG